MLVNKDIYWHRGADLTPIKHRRTHMRQDSWYALTAAQYLLKNKKIAEKSKKQ